MYLIFLRISRNDDIIVRICKIIVVFFDIDETEKYVMYSYMNPVQRHWGDINYDIAI